MFEIHLHLVWVTKYRKPVLVGDVGLRVRDLIRQVCQEHEVTILKGHVSKDHVHLLASIEPQVTISRLVQWLKGKSAYKLLHEFPMLQKKFWGRHIWARGYFCCSSGNITDEVILHTSRIKLMKVWMMIFEWKVRSFSLLEQDTYSRAWLGKWAF